VYEIMDLLGCDYDTKQVGLFVWAKVPSNYNNCYDLADDVLYKPKVFITPGGIFGSAGEQYIRISLCGKIETLEAAIERLKANL